MNDNQIFPFSKTNYLIVLGGLILLVVGYLLMSGGGSDDPNTFKGTYSLTTESFEKLSNDFQLDQSIIDNLKPLENKSFPSEEELKTAIANQLENAFEKNYYPIRSATHIDADIFSPRRITLAPFVVLLGYFIVLFGILYREKQINLSKIHNNTQLAD